MAVKYAPRVTPVPTNLVTNSEIGGVSLSWAYLVAPIGFTRFDIYRDGIYLGTTTGTSYGDTSASSGVTYDYTVVSVRTNPHNGQPYQSAPSNTASGSWTSAARADIDILSIVNIDSGPTIAVNNVTGADHYRFERSSDPLIGFAQVGADQVGTSFQDTTGTAGLIYYYRVRPVTSGVAGTASGSRAGGKTASGADTIALASSLTLSRTFSSIGYMLAYTGDANRSAKRAVEFSADGGVTWRHGDTPDQWSDGTNRYIVGSIVECDADTDYIVQVTVVDAGGGGGVVRGSKRTRAELAAMPAYASKTHLLAASGGNYTTTDQAMTAVNAATGDMIVGIKNGYYRRPTNAFTGNGKVVRWVAETPCIGDPVSITNGTDYAPEATTTPVSITDPGRVIFYDYYTAPNGSSDSGSLGNNVWTPVTVGDVTVYRLNLSGQNVANVKHVTYRQVSGTDYAGAKAGTPRRANNWKASGANLGTAEGWAAFTESNLSYHAGHYQNGNLATTGTYATGVGDKFFLWLRLPDDVDPNECYVWIGANTGASCKPGFDFKGDDLVVTGVDFRGIPGNVHVSPGADRCTLDHCLMEDGQMGVLVNATSGGIYVTDFTMQYCRVRHTGLWNGDIPWTFVKQFILMGDGVSLYSPNRIGAESESQGLKMIKSGQNIVVRYCTFEGTFNAVGSNSGNTDIFSQNSVDIHDCLMDGIADNAIEPEGPNVNWRVWNNVFLEGRNMYSTDFSHGPFYAWRNQIYNWGVQGIASHGIPGDVPGQQNHGGFGQYVKYGSGRTPGPLIVMYHETAFSLQTGSKGFTDAVGSPLQERWRRRNCILVAPTYPTQNIPLANWDDDYSYYATADGSLAVQVGSVNYNSASLTGAQSIAAYRTATGLGANTNKYGGTDYNFVGGGLSLIRDTLLADPENGDLSLAVSAPGKALANFSDGGGTVNVGWED